MKLLSILSVSVIMVLSGCGRTQLEKEQNNQTNAKELIQNLVYIKDKKTGLCFAYTWHGGGYGGPAFTEVSCREVEDYLVK